jgi:hypothetical protein
MEHVNHRICKDIEDVVPLKVWWRRRKKTTLSTNNVLSKGKLRLVFFERGQHFGFDKYFHCLYQDFP